MRGMTHASPGSIEAGQAEPYELQYDGLLLRYRPQSTGDGRYIPFVVICQCIDGETEGELTTLIAMTADPAPLLDEADAARAGLAAGYEWILKRFNRARSISRTGRRS